MSFVVTAVAEEGEEEAMVAVVAAGAGLGAVVVRNLVVVEVLVVWARGRRVRAVAFAAAAAAVETRAACMVVTWEGGAWWRGVLNGVIYTDCDGGFGTRWAPGLNGGMSCYWAWITRSEGA